MFQVNIKTGKMKVSYQRYLYALQLGASNTSGQQAQLDGSKGKVTKG